MSINPETDLDLEKLFLPSWAQEPKDTNRYANYEGDHDDRRDRRGKRRDRPREESRGPRSRDDRPRGDRPGGGRPRSGRGRPGHRGQPGAGPQRFERKPPAPLPEVNLTLEAEDQGAAMLARQIKTTGRAYPLFEIAALLLQKPDRYNAVFTVKRNDQGEPIQPLFICALDQSLWLSMEDAVAHVLKKHLETFYQVERVQTDPPKGTYTFVAQCGISGVILGPPNHHDYQSKLRDLHAKRFARMPFDRFKSRIKIVRDEEVVKKWVEDQSWKTEYIALNVPEALKLPDLNEVEKHFREVHAPNIIQQVDSHVMNGKACGALRGGLHSMFRRSLEDQRRFPMQLATSLSQKFASNGLQFFKVNKTITHVWVARPNYLDLDSAPVSDSVRRIVQFINEHPKCTRRQLVETLAPSPESPKPEQPASGTTEEPAPEAGEKPASAQGPKAEHAPQEAPAPTPEQTALIGDLHWLVHQGHVIEFANGTLETAKKPLPRPQKRKAEAKPADQAKPAPPVAGVAPGASEKPETTQDVPGKVQEEQAVGDATDEGGSAVGSPNPVASERDLQVAQDTPVEERSPGEEGKPDASAEPPSSPTDSDSEDRDRKQDPSASA